MANRTPITIDTHEVTNAFFFFLETDNETLTKKVREAEKTYFSFLGSSDIKHLSNEEQHNYIQKHSHDVSEFVNKGKGKDDVILYLMFLSFANNKKTIEESIPFIFEKYEMFANEMIRLNKGFQELLAKSFERESQDLREHQANMILHESLQS